MNNKIVYNIVGLWIMEWGLGCWIFTGGWVIFDNGDDIGGLTTNSGQVELGHWVDDIIYDIFVYDVNNSVYLVTILIINISIVLLLLHYWYY